MEHNYDRHYPVSRFDAKRICAWHEDQWSRDKKTVRHLECNRPFFQWNEQQNTEPWALCPKHAQPKENYKKKPK